VQLLPAGAFRSLDGRPKEVEHWLLSAADAAPLVAAAAARGTPYVFDYEHQSLSAASEGHKAPAAGWFQALEWIDGEGLFATDVQWTDTARRLIEDDEYRYVSPVFTWDRASGRITGLINAALTNNPGLDGMRMVADLVAARIALAAPLTFPAKDAPMDELLDRLRQFLNLPASADVAELTAELAALSTQLGAAPEAASTLTLGARLHAALSIQSPDPAQYVPLTVHAEVQNELAALRTQQAEQERSALLTAALADGRILPPTEAYWRAQPVAALRAFLEVAQPMTALGGTQTQGRPPTRDTAPAFATPHGHHVDAERLTLHLAATDFARKHGVSYAQALRELEVDQHRNP